jgi:hypothetical protein
VSVQPQLEQASAGVVESAPAESKDAKMIDRFMSQSP